MNITVRDATEDDLPAIVDIYNQSIPGAWSTADTKPVTVSDRREWFSKHDPSKRPLWVAEIGGSVVAWIGLTSFYAGRPAYDATAEVSLYIASAYQKMGIGTFLKKRMIEHCPRLGVTSLISMHFDHNAATARINAQLGFEEAGRLSEIALVNGQKRGLVISICRIPLIEN
ncbi:MAG TPA: GNAT family N-acetyltransferase [Rhodocyclaceae bacterium]|nr:GNAT family N-acetyltransferase [Rhodocyclaceae bacterium]